ncbi:MAG: hypothetical protein KKC79_04050 [Gammaproteobacteria bacterium]|nr:hypothetical protein [Gammaproteobacteria bacterium]MBU2407804.1 hypothetical protein [Gammaproteobacteria bacterium]
MILFKTPVGQQAFKERSVTLTPRQRSAFILCDGKRSVDDVLSATAGIGREEIEQMISLGLLDRGATQVSGPVSELHAEGLNDARIDAPVARTSQQRYQDAYPIAIRLTGALGLRGFRLNLAVEGTSSYEELLALAPKIRAAVGPEKAAPLDQALTA